MREKTAHELVAESEKMRPRLAELRDQIAASQAESARIRAERLPLIEERVALERSIDRLARIAKKTAAKEKRLADEQAERDRVLADLPR